MIRITFSGPVQYLRHEVFGDGLVEIYFRPLTAEATVATETRHVRRTPTFPGVEVSAIDQGDQLIVRRAGGDVVRPARTASGKVAVRIGDSIDLVDGRDGLVRMHLQRVER